MFPIYLSLSLVRSRFTYRELMWGSDGVPEQVLSKKKEIEFVEIPALPLYILAHLVEAFVTFCLLLHSFVYTQPPPAGPASENDQKGKKRERVEPSSPTSFKYDPMGYIESILGPDLRILQPATFEVACVDCVLDDSKFREVTG